MGWFSSELWSDEEDVEEEGVKGEECNESLAANMVWGAFTTTSTLDKSNEEEGGGGFKLLPRSRGGEHKGVTQPTRLRAGGMGSDKKKGVVIFGTTGQTKMTAQF